jgi:mRNA interferase MazF
MHKGEIWRINLDPTIGAEIHKTRPAIIISEDAIEILPLRVIVPLTAWKERYTVAPWMVKIDPDAENGLDKPSAADAFQIRSVSQARFVERMGKITLEQRSKILQAAQVVIGA